ncbi:MAG: 2-oxoglutarate dehydrogenase complex dihydrolipoyllysine-residue succinyltransferase [Gammaproteobacteria bacterium]|nr:2-oxoglutarate dehydrogenase complex dihydrolipoyllysine-residue succinyltransferase [Gammaproteobacteria bacterium]MCG3143009.1 Dihydrolipoyllysine-residue succinyltransferase component of 2-oxoglutarate dehydrogenase complex [Gammaproteobacteria bacterium]
MLVEVKVPVLAESVADATLMEWQKQPGERVRRGDRLIDLETDKVTLEVAAPEDGVVKEIRKKSGESATSNEILAVIDTDAAATASAPAAAAPATAPRREAAEPKLSPAVRKLAAEHAVDAAQLPAGREGRVTKADVVEYLKRGPAASPLALTNEESSQILPPMVSEPQSAPVRSEQRVPMSRLRRRAAERLLAAQRDNAILTTFNEINMQPVMSLRERYRDTFERTHGVKLGFMGFFLKAAVEALKKFPVINASIDGDDILYHNYFDIGVAVSAPRGLVVPVLRDVEQLSLAEAEKQIRDLSEKARSNALSIEELSGGTFTITNGGVFGSLMSTPIINPPQSAIFGMHKTQERPVAERGQVVIRPMMYVALSYDHRIIDGREAVQFLVHVKELLEDPARILLQI